MKPNMLAIALGGAVLAGLIAVILAIFWIGGSEKPQVDIRVVQALSDLPVGQKIKPDSLMLVVVPQDKVQPGAIFDINAVAGRVSKAPIAKGETVVEAMLQPMITGDDLSSDLPYGMRGFTIAVNEISSVGGFASPGNYVDVMLSAKDSFGQPLSKIVVKKVRVLAVAQSHSFSDATPKLGSSITLEVTPEQAQQLDVARSLGTLSLVLRNRNDDKVTQPSVVGRKDVNAMMGDDATNTIEVIRGSMAPVTVDSNFNSQNGTSPQGFINR